ncbi:hypothetical protein M0804_015209 [Polistes exclamans]|nr:hypothetical protein M0804_015209 [Polistes exclamans]
MTSGDRLFCEHFFFSKKIVQSILGLHPDQSQNDQLFSLCAIIFFTIPGVVHQIYQLFSSEVTLQSTVGVLQKIIGAVVLLSAYSTTYFNFVTMKLLLTTANAIWEQIVNEEELIFLDDSIKQSKLYVYTVIGIFNGYSISVITPCVAKVFLYFLGILDENQLSLLLPVNSVSKAGAQYFGLLIYQIMAIIIIVIVGGVSFSGYLMSITFACYQFRVIIFRIHRPFERNVKYMEKDWCFRTSQEEWDWIIDIINRSKKVTEYIDLINDFSKICYLVTLVFSTTAIVFDFLYIFQLSIDPQNVTEIVECSFYITGSILTIYINFYLGQMLMNYSDVVFKELCQIPFYVLLNKTQKLLLFMIGRSCKPSMLSIGGMFVSTHETFAVVMRKAFSFAMVYYSTL